MLNPNKITHNHADADCVAVSLAFDAARTEARTRAALPRAAGPQRAAMVALLDAAGMVWITFAPRAFGAI